MKYKITIYKEVYTDIEIDADSEDAAKDIALLGLYNENEIIDTSVKESEIIDCKIVD